MPIIAIAPSSTSCSTGTSRRWSWRRERLFHHPGGMSAGLRSADQLTLDLVHAYGGTSWTALVKVRIRAALPSLFAALRIAPRPPFSGPSSASTGRQLRARGGHDQRRTVPGRHRVWSLALFAAAIAGVGYAVTGMVGRLATPWARGTASGTKHAAPAAAGGCPDGRPAPWASWLSPYWSPWCAGSASSSSSTQLLLRQKPGGRMGYLAQGRRPPPTACSCGRPWSPRCATRRSATCSGRSWRGRRHDGGHLPQRRGRLHAVAVVLRSVPWWR